MSRDDRNEFDQLNAPYDLTYFFDDDPGYSQAIRSRF